MYLLHLLIVVKDLFCKLRNVNASVALSRNIEIVSLELFVLGEELNEGNQVVLGH
jgi:hypothetical protein